MKKEDLTRDELLEFKEITMNENIELNEEVYESDFFKNLVNHIEKELENN
ncbi:MAG: hypothetical protein R3Y64_03885 [Peptostreptococcaceae bacterium]